MIKLRPMLSFMLLGTLSVVAMSCSTVEQTPNVEGEPDRSADEAAIRAKIAENEAATNRLDATAALMCCIFMMQRAVQEEGYGVSAEVAVLAASRS